MSTEDESKILVVGGGFAGQAAVRELQSKQGSNQLSITVVDRKPFFEFTPAILRCMVHPEHLQRVTSSQSHPNVRFIQGIAYGLSNSGVTVRKNTGAHGDHPSSSSDVFLKYDYCIWATGATYAAPITSAGEADLGTTNRHDELTRFRSEMMRAERIVIVGAGPIGVELAAEVANVTYSLPSDTKVTLVASPRGVLPGLPRRAGKYVTQHLQKLGVRVVHGRYIPRKNNMQNNNTFTYVDSNIPPELANANAITADLAIDCTGPRPAPDAPFELTPRGWISTQNTLQAKGLTRVFVAGDVAELPDRPPTRSGISNYGAARTAISADEAGRIAARNILTLMQAESTGREPRLLRFPQDAFPQGNYPSMMVVSLYKNDAILCLGPLTLHGLIAAKMKDMIEAINVSVAQGSHTSAIMSSVSRKFGFITALVLAIVVRGIEDVSTTICAVFRSIRLKEGFV